ncbi:MAG: beta-lactamase family protein [Bacteroidales bacterium]|nr:beta-lactamase family protein [Bacteroidales bacterium]
MKGTRLQWNIGKYNKFTLNLFLLFVIISISSCHIGRYFIWNFADAGDYKKFPSDTISKGNYTFIFPKIDRNLPLNIPEKYSAKQIDFDKFLEKNKTLALLIIRNDTIQYENYFSNYDENNIHPSFSVTKAFVSALTAIAIDEAYIQSIKQPVTDFLPELRDTNFREVKIEDLLNMQSGLDYKEWYANPFGKMAKFYYGKNLKKYTNDLRIAGKPGLTYEYQSANAQLLSFIIEKATGKRISNYLEEKIWQPLEMEYFGSWNYDSKKYKNTKGFCCLNGRARDFAKFGRLYLNKGRWNGKQIIPSEWVKTSSSIINNSLDSQGYHYTYMWRVTDSGAYFAKGYLGQYIWIYPKKNIVIVSMVTSYSKIDWADLFQHLSDQL